MDPSAHIPLCPTGFTCFLLDRGWSWDAALLDEAVGWLAAQDITDEEATVGVEFAHLVNIGRWSEEVILAHTFVGRLYNVTGQVQLFWKQLFSASYGCLLWLNALCLNAWQGSVKKRKMLDILPVAADHSRVTGLVENVFGLVDKPTTVLAVQGLCRLRAVTVLILSYFCARCETTGRS
jgi:hypothetical protein